MARGEEKDTLGTWAESTIERASIASGYAAGLASGLLVLNNSGVESLSSPEEGIALTGVLGSLLAGGFIGNKIANQVGGVSERIDRKIYDNSELYPDSNRDGGVDDRIEETTCGGFTGFQGEFKSHRKLRGQFKSGHVDTEEEVFIQVPRYGDTFEEKMARVQTWKNNKKELDQADQHIDQILEEDGDNKIGADYEYLRKHEETLRRIVNGGIKTPSEKYDIVITSHEGQPIPVLVGEYNRDMVEDSRYVALDDRKRQKILGEYMKALVEKDEIQGYPDDWGPRRNTFYDPDTGTVGVTDLGELLRAEESVDTPDITL